MDWRKVAGVDNVNSLEKLDVRNESPTGHLVRSDRRLTESSADQVPVFTLDESMFPETPDHRYFLKLLAAVAMAMANSTEKGRITKFGCMLVGMPR